MRILMMALLAFTGLLTSGHTQNLAESLGFNVPCEGAVKPVCKNGSVAQVSQGICYGYVCTEETVSVSGEICPAIANCPAGSTGTKITDARGCPAMKCAANFKTTCETRDTILCPASQKPLATTNYDQNGCTIYICQSEDLLSATACPAQPACPTGYMQTYIKTVDNCAQVECRGINKIDGAACPLPPSCPPGYEIAGDVWNKGCPTNKCRIRSNSMCTRANYIARLVGAKECPREFGLPTTILSGETLPNASSTPTFNEPKPNDNRFDGGR
ncbi:MAG: hypothetical protein EON60_05450 [Alphaproteobacteria bacterium]|nr:MAG: hypothetical protein EON60_05450 [Alphaproteobacteria bacterium]